MLPNVFAYLDIASGSMIVQAATAGIVVVPVLMRNKIRGLFGRNKPTPGTDPNPESEASAADVAPNSTDADAMGSDRS